MSLAPDKCFHEYICPNRVVFSIAVVGDKAVNAEARVTLYVKKNLRMRKARYAERERERERER